MSTTPPKITAYLKTFCGWSEGVRAIMRKYDLPYEEKDIIKNPAFRWEMEQRSGQRSVAEDLKMLYERAAGQAIEKRRLQQRLAQMEQEEREEEEAEEREPIVTSISFQFSARSLLPRTVRPS